MEYTSIMFMIYLSNNSLRTEASVLESVETPYVS